MTTPVTPAQNDPTSKPKTDPYALKYMGGAQALALTRKAMPWWYHTLFLAIALVEIGAAVATHLWGLLAIVPIVGLLWIMFTHARVAVTTENVHVQLGVFGPRIPIDRIDRASVEKYDALKFGGYGIKRSSDGTTAYSVAGGTGMGVRIEHHDEHGKAKSVFVSTDDPESIVAAILRAKTEKSAKTRIADSTPDETADAADEPAQEQRQRESGAR